MLKRLGGSYAIRRAIRTLNRPPLPVIDVASQLREYPESVRSEMLQQLNAKPTAQAGAVFGEKVSDAEFLAGIIEQSLVSAENPQSLDAPFWNAVHSFAKTLIKTKNPGHIELFVTLFEAAKQIPDEKQRIKQIFTVGKYIYRLKKVRMDPVNEVEFLDSLVAFNRPFVALKLWRSREGREDLAGFEDYWTVVGILYHLEAGLLSRANKMALESSAVNLKISAYLIDAFSRQLSRNYDPESTSQFLRHWFDFVVADVAALNSPESLEFTSQITRSLIAARQWEMAAEIVETLPEINISEFKDAFVAAIRAKSTDQDFLNLFQVLATKSPELATDPVVGASMALSLGRQAEFDMALAVLEELRMRKVAVPPVFQVPIYRAFELQAPSEKTLEARRLVTDPK